MVARGLRIPVRLAKLLWALPYTLLGLSIGLAGVLTGGRLHIVDGVAECSGGATQSFLRWLGGDGIILGLTLGHVVLGPTPAALDISRTHERVHVRQFERWGPLMGPAYFAAMGWIWLMGSGDPYRDNPFEREAYDADP